MRSVAVLAVLVFTTTARAQPGNVAPVEPAVPPEPPRPSYRLQTLAADGMAIATIATMVLLPELTAEHVNDAIGPLWLAPYVLGAPVVHAAHDRWGRALGSTALRLGMPLLGGMIGASIHPGDNHDDWSGLIGGIMVGMVVAMVADTAVLSAGASEPPREPNTRVARSSWGPMVHAGRNQVSAGIGGAF
jgi:hypothetical protein